MGTASGPSTQARGRATLTPNGAKGRYGVAYLRAVCSHAGFGFQETSIDEDTLAIDGCISFEQAEVRVQIKCTSQFKISGNSATWASEPGWFEKWNRSRVPVYFILVIVDEDELRWLEHNPDGTLHRAAAFWVRVDRMSATTGINVPKEQRLTAATVRQWADELAAGYVPLSEEAL
ncbi:DUF4365 domain-containing protein [Micromonospora sp. NPDC005113]